MKSFGLQRKVFEASKLVLIGEALVDKSTLAKCLIVFNLEKQEIEKLKILSFLEH